MYKTIKSLTWNAHIHTHTQRLKGSFRTHSAVCSMNEWWSHRALLHASVGGRESCCHGSILQSQQPSCIIWKISEGGNSVTSLTHEGAGLGRRIWFWTNETLKHLKRQRCARCSLSNSPLSLCEMRGGLGGCGCACGWESAHMGEKNKKTR